MQADFLLEDSRTQPFSAPRYIQSVAYAVSFARPIWPCSSKQRQDSARPHITYNLSAFLSSKTFMHSSLFSFSLPYFLFSCPSPHRLPQNPISCLSYYHRSISGTPSSIQSPYHHSHIRCPNHFHPLNQAYSQDPRFGLSGCCRVFDVCFDLDKIAWTEEECVELLYVRGLP